MSSSKEAKRAADVVDAYARNWTVELEFDPVALPENRIPSETLAAQNYLASATLSVENALAAASRQRSIRLAYEGKAPSGRYSEADQDLLRAALVFAGAGLDSTLKRLLRDCLAAMTQRSELARSELTTFAEQEISTDSGGLERATLVELFLSDSPRVVLERRYLDALIGGSLQSSHGVRRVARALGVEGKDFYRRIDPDKSDRPLNQMFRARNEMIHQLDLRDPDEGTRGSLAHRRVTREIGKTTAWVTEALAVAQFMINDVSIRIGEP